MEADDSGAGGHETLQGDHICRDVHV